MHSPVLRRTLLEGLFWRMLLYPDGLESRRRMVFGRVRRVLQSFVSSSALQALVRPALTSGTDFEQGIERRVSAAVRRAGLEALDRRSRLGRL